MLKELRIQNIILVEKADIEFKSGLNILSGETGAGKSAVLHAASLILGERADTALIRKGAEKAMVEALFDVSKVENLKELLQDAGLEPDEEGTLIVRRELFSGGKSRAFINDRLVQLPLLKQIGDHLIDMISQHAGKRLFSTDVHRDLLDVYADLKELSDKFAESFNLESRLQKELASLIEEEPARVREIEVCQMELSEIMEANFKDGQEEELFQEFSFLSNSEERAELLENLIKGLDDDRGAALPNLKRLLVVLQKSAELDPSLKVTLDSFSAAVIEIEEASYTIRSAKNKIDADPQKLYELNERLQLLNRLKRKYGKTLSEIQQYADSKSKRLQELEGADEKIEELKGVISNLMQENDHLALTLSSERRKAAQIFEKELTDQLQSLNMKNATFHIRLSEAKRSSHGDEKVEFFLAPNVGEKEIALKDSASGGEISRVLLSLQTLLCGKAKLATLIFDEIDANIGGSTAAIIGDKLLSIGTHTQVICITHFPQVAKFADHHLCISKKEEGGRTFSEIVTLSGQNRKKEIARMLGEGH